MQNELVRYSRAGDVFHYRWAARRCLRMIYPKSPLRFIIIEGSKDAELPGEYVIDMAEYSEVEEGKEEEIAYFQLKHTTVRNDQPFELSDLKDTVEGFAERYAEHFCRKSKSPKLTKVTFSIVTNRPIAESFKQNISILSKGSTVNKRFNNTLQKYTGLTGKDLTDFCTMLVFVDGEGDYNSQKYKLHVEISQLLAGTVDNPIIDSITSLVQQKALPNTDGRIVPEEILKRLGVTSQRDLFPAPSQFEGINNSILRRQHQTLMDSILNAATPVIIHAAGGVGKSVFAQQVVNSLPVTSLGIVYDCFGGGRYRNRSEPRHRHRDALVQVVNELASLGLCDPILAPAVALEDEILRKFLERIGMAAHCLRQADEKAILVILIDAADNTEMAAKEFGQHCFAHELMRETLPEGVRLVALCRTERIDLLQPLSIIPQLELQPFSTEETLIHLRSRFPQATETDGLEFHRLTNNGNPRVQANALNLGYDTITETLDSLGPAGTTVEKQIEAQLDSAISILKETIPADYQRGIEAICSGLATLPPLIPLNVLATAAEVDETMVISLIADLGHHLWLSDTSVQFRDEPTETWFKEKFSATIEQIDSYINLLKPLTLKYTYVAETLPFLLLQAKKYGELIELALSDDLLPRNNPIDERNVRVYRLQFAFKAAMKLQRYVDATKLAMRAGEEVAGDKRQLQLLKQNVDLIASLQNDLKVQELAFRRMLRSGWDGSENVYSASLLSSVKDFQGEARGYLRAAHNWLHLYFEERRKSKDKYRYDHVKDDDIVEMAFAYLNIFGLSKTVAFIESWRPQKFVYQIIRPLIGRLIDSGNFDMVNEISLISSRNQYMIIAIAYELLKAGRLPNIDSLRQCLILLSTRRTRIPKPEYLDNDTIALAIVSFTEACAAMNLEKSKILRILKHYVPIKASGSVTSNFQHNEREVYLRAVALRFVLLGNYEPVIDELLPTQLSNKEKTYRDDQELREFKEIVAGLLPWYIVRTRILLNDIENPFQAIEEADKFSKQARGQRWKEFDILPFEISRICVQILTLCKSLGPVGIKSFIDGYLTGNSKIRISDRLTAVRAACRLDHLSGVKRQLEKSVYEVVASDTSEGPETRAEWYIEMARAILPTSPDDAVAYFDLAIEAVSKFGDEIVERWEAVRAIANRSAEGGCSSLELAYRFIRCAELVGNNVAREKHFNRNGAIRTCVKLSPISALAALSRWRDRDVGWFDKQLPALAKEIVDSEFLPPLVGWSLSAFYTGGGLDDFATICVDKEPSAIGKKIIIDTTCRDLAMYEASEKSFRKMKGLAEKHFIENADLDEVLAFYSDNPSERFVVAQPFEYLNNQKESDTFDFGEIFSGLDLTTSSGISHAIQRFDATAPIPHNLSAFWQEVFSRVKEYHSIEFLNALVMAESADLYKIKNAFSLLPKDWRDKVSFKRNWTNILETLARRFATQLTDQDILDCFLKDIQVDDSQRLSVTKGILQGLSGNSCLADASTYFGFPTIVSAFISPQEATDLLDFALSRFELHIDEAYADGSWASWLIPPENISESFAGFVWSALGSPKSKTRWQAAHCIRRLAQVNCQTEIGALIQWMEKEKVGAFGSCKFPFYNLHACLYLLIALARISLDNPQILLPYNEIFIVNALSAIQHILIQKFSAEIALNIEKAFPGMYHSDIVEQLSRIGISQFPIKTIKSNSKRIDSYWHSRGEVDTSLEFLHSYDFDRYWHDPLGEVFGISGKQVEELATEVVIKEWHSNTDGSYGHDPRARLWTSTRHEKETWHDHFSYPRTDNYSFYLSYHSMFVVAAKLLEKMPVVHSRDWHENKWEGWLGRHLLTRYDGRWLADRRDPAPLIRRKWIYEHQSEDTWLSEIKNDDGLDGILFSRNGETWLNVFGSWNDGDSQRSETLYVSSAFVSPEASQSLLNVLCNCSNLHDFKLPDYEEDNMEFEIGPFNLKGWIRLNSYNNRLDEFDPFAAEIYYPPYQIGKSIIEQLKLFSDAEQRQWLITGEDRPSLVCEIWSSNKSEYDKDRWRHGIKLSSSLQFLRNLCVITGKELIIEFQMNRRFKNNYGRSDNGYQPPFSKIYIFSKDGELRDERTSYKLR